MSFLPVAERELRQLARHPRTYTARVLNVLFVLVLSLGMLYAGFGGSLSAGAAGRDLFILLSLAAGFYVVLDGALMTADCISSEKREGTLGLLFLTDLKGYDVVAGKLISRTASSTYCLLAALPALGIALFLGGVTGRDFYSMMLALLNGLFFSTCFGMFVSSVVRRERPAVLLSVLGTVTFAILIPGLGWGLSVHWNIPGIDPRFLIASPAGAFWAALQANQPGANLGYSFGQSLALTHFMGWGFLLAASLVLPHAWRETSRSGTSVPKKSKRRFKFKPFLARSRSGPEAWQILRLGDNRANAGLGIWPIFLVLLLAGATGILMEKGGRLTIPIFTATALLLHLALCLAVLIQACRGPAEDQQNGTLELLLTTPLGEVVYRRGRLLQVKRHCLWPLMIILAIDLGLVVTGCWFSGTFNWEWIVWIGAFLILSTKLLIDLYALSWIGLWQGLKTGSTRRAIRATIFQVFLLKWVILLGCIAFIGILTQGRVFQSALAGMIGVTGYVVLLVMTLLNSGGRAVTDLHDNLRELALSHSEEPSTFWPQLRKRGMRLRRLLPGRSTSTTIPRFPAREI